MQPHDSLFSKGVDLYNDGEYEKALSIFDSFLYLSEKDSDALLHKWNTLGALGRFSESIDAFDKIISNDPSNLAAKKAKEIFGAIARHSSEETILPPPQAMPLPVSAVIAEKQVCREMSDNPKADKQEPMQSCEISDPENIAEISCGAYPESEGEPLSFPQGDSWSEDRFLTQETRIFFKKNELKKLNIPKIVDDPLTNSYDRNKIIDYIEKADPIGLAGFIKNVTLRNSILAHLADSNILPPRKYNTILSQIARIDAEFALAFLMFNIGERKYHEILVHLWEKPVMIVIEPSPEKVVEKSEKIGIIKIILNFFLWIFSFEKSFANENNKLRYFKYLFVFLGFLWMLTLVWYGIKNDLFKVDISATRTITASWSTESVTSVKRENM